jgi:Xaa-Pro dipeptidase
MLLNRLRALEYMRACDLDAIVATSPVNVRYLSDFYCWLGAQMREYMVSPGGSGRLVPQNFAVFLLEGDPALVVEPYFALHASRSWVQDVKLAGGEGFEDPGEDHTGDGFPPLRSELRRVLELIRTASGASPVEALTAALEERGLADGRLGVELDGLAHEVAAELRDRLPRAQLLDCTNLLRLVRAAKSPDEMSRLERAAGAAEDAAAAAFASGGPGRPLAELEAVYRTRLGELGVEFDHFAFGPQGLGLVPHSDHVLAPGEAIFADWGCLHEGYFSDTGTTLAVGPLAPDLEHRFEATVASVQAGADAVRPGVRASEVQAAMQAAMGEAGITASNPHGHGFGLDVRDYPIIAPATGRPIRDDCVEVPSDLPLEEGMVLNLEAPLFMLARGSVHTERSFVVIAGGCRPLVDQARQTPVEMLGERRPEGVEALAIPAEGVAANGAEKGPTSEGEERVV